MATKNFCDACGADITDASKRWVAEIYAAASGPQVSADLCRSCVEKAYKAIGK